MNERAPDALELLLPQAPARAQERARKVATFFRLLSNDATPAHARTVVINLERAQSELDRQVKERLSSSLVDLLRHHLYALTPADSFAWYGEPKAPAQRAWSALEEMRGELPWLAHVPAPAEPPARVAERVLKSLTRVEAPQDLVRLWAVRLERAVRGPSSGEAILRSLVERKAGSELRPALRRAASVAIAECLLDRGCIGRAKTWLENETKASLAEPPGVRLRWLSAWTSLLLGDASEARRLVESAVPWRGRLPAGLAELRAEKPEWLALLPGKPADGSASPCTHGAALSPAHSDASAAEQPVRLRASVGASVLAVFSFCPRQGTHPVLLDVAPALLDRVPGWLRSREAAAAGSSEPEHSLVASARTVRAHRGDGATLRGAMGGAAVRSMALVPIRSGDGEVAGWVHLEFEHHLLPWSARLERIADDWKAEVLRAASAVQAPIEIQQRKSPLAAGADEMANSAWPEKISQWPEKISDGPGARVFRDIVDGLAMKTKERRWWGFEVWEGRLQLAAEGGQGLASEPGSPEFRGPSRGAARGLSRALAASGTVVFGEPDAALSIHPQAASGVVIALQDKRRIYGLLAIESSRRRDFDHGDVARLERELAGIGVVLRTAQFRRWHMEHFGCDVFFDPRREGFGARVRDVVAAGAARVPVALCGPRGTGKRVVARWLHFESERRGGPLLAYVCGNQSPERAERALFGAGETFEARRVLGMDPSKKGNGLIGRARSGSLLLHHVHLLPHTVQTQLCAFLDDREARLDQASGGIEPRVIATAIPSLTEAVASGDLLAGLAQRLDRVQLYVPPLCERREEISSLIDLFTRRFAEEERVPSPRLSDEAVALLWRQDYEGNLRELANWIYKLVLLYSGEDVSPEALQAFARRFRLELRQRTPSRHPEPRDLLAALHTTRTQRGSWNKSRAALYLGWDPDTLASRMREAEIPSDESATPRTD